MHFMAKRRESLPLVGEAEGSGGLKDGAIDIEDYLNGGPYNRLPWLQVR